MSTPEADQAMSNSDDEITPRAAKTARPRSPTISNDSDIREDLDMDSMQRMSQEDRKIVAQVILGVDVTEIYSPERVAKVAKEFGLVPGSSMDLTSGWHFTRSDHR